MALFCNSLDDRNIISFSLVILTVIFVKCNCLEINGKDYHVHHVSENQISRRFLHLEVVNASSTWVARSVYNKSYFSIGWDSFDLETNPDIIDDEQAFLAGYLEGVETHDAIYDHYHNVLKSACDNEKELCEQVERFLATNTEWIKHMVEQHSPTDIYWRQVQLFYLQLEGMALGYNHAAPAEKKLTIRDIMWMNFDWDIRDLKSSMRNETNRALKGESRCSALIKLLRSKSDILVAHTTWTGYETMRRIVKRYTLPYKQVVGTSQSFPSYPALVVSEDDYYIINSGLVVQETTNDNNNASLWSYIQPTGQVLEIVRLAVANRLADGGRSWGKIFSQYNSGTFNNQWMIVDMKKFSPGSIQPELLWVLEQMPGYIHSEDQTDVLTTQSYWASYNIPFYPDIFNMSGTPALVQEYGDFFTHDKTPRAQIFRRDHDQVLNVHTMMSLMRSNNFTQDPLSKCDCNPPYNAYYALAARGDLNLANGIYPFDALGHRSFGATDAKVTNYQLSKNLSLWAVAGPPTGADLPPFQWSKSDFDHKLSHHGHPDLFHFDPVLFTWPTENSSFGQHKAV